MDMSPVMPDHPSRPMFRQVILMLPKEEYQLFEQLHAAGLATLSAKDRPATTMPEFIANCARVGFKVLAEQLKQAKQTERRIILP